MNRNKMCVIAIVCLITTGILWACGQSSYWAGDDACEHEEAKCDFGNTIVEACAGEEEWKCDIGLPYEECEEYSLDCYGTFACYEHLHLCKEGETEPYACIYHWVGDLTCFGGKIWTR